ncbi:MAG: DUF2029 domain-containing protein [Candidatus Dadabacteria bacterium]|nr:MAG: DUF2029 domain-containing protein [Candidatus Dadabacteria bacterium]
MLVNRKIRVSIYIFLIALFTFVLISEGIPEHFGSVDLVQYWAAAKLLISGKNPYNPDFITELERKVVNFGEAVLLWNPPLIFIVIVPFALVSFSLLVFLWGFISTALYLTSYKLCSSAYDFNYSIPKVLLFLRSITFLSFYPCALALYYGQISPLLLLGLSGFIYFALKSKKNKHSFLAGSFLALTLIKPHLLYLFYIALLWRTISSRDYNWLTGFLGTTLLFALFPLIFNSDIYHYYLKAALNPPINFQTPTVGSWLQGLSGIHRLFIRFLPTLITALGFIAFLLIRRPVISLQDTAAIIPLSLITSPYGWVYDYVLMFPVIFWIFTRLLADNSKVTSYTFLIPAVMLLSNISMAVGLTGKGLQNYIWFPFVYVLICGFLWLKKSDACVSPAHRH